MKLKEAVSIELKGVTGKLNMLVWGRLLSFLAIPFWIYLTHENTFIMIPGVLFVIAVFLFLVKSYAVLESRRKLLREKLVVLQHELSSEQGSVKDWPEGKEYRSTDHPFTEDLDIFGPDSMFQRLCRNLTYGAESLLADWLCSQDLQKAEWSHRKSAVNEWSHKLEERIDLLTNASLLSKEKEKSSRLIELVEKEIGVSAMLKAMLFIIPLLSIATIGLYAFDVITEKILVLYLLASLGITGMFIKRINAVYTDWSDVLSLMKNYSAMFAIISESSWTANLNLDLKEKVIGAEAAITSLSKIISTFDQRNNQLLGIPMNALVQMDLQQVHRLYKWKIKHRSKIKEWIVTMDQLQVLASLGSYVYVHRERLSEANWNQDAFSLQMKGLVHPFMNKAVSNELSFSSGDGIVIVTGANMAGKSTFLRAVGTNLVLSRITGMAHADEFEFSDMDLFSSMRSTDSVQRGQSYFFNELSRLKKLVEYRHPNKPLFVLLDEILKGTNSADKARGSWLFVERLLQDDIRGIVATHDLSLTKISEEYPDKIRNMRFEVDITDNGLHFDYKLKGGVCQTMNASYLLNEMGLTPNNSKS